MKARKLQEVVNDFIDNGIMSYIEYYKTNNYLSIAEKADKFY